MTKLERLEKEKRAYQDLLIMKELPKWHKEIKEKGLEPTLIELIRMAMDAEMRAELAEKELAEYARNSIKIAFGR